MKLVSVQSCNLCDDGLLVEYTDGRILIFPTHFLRSNRVTNARLVAVNADWVKQNAKVVRKRGEVKVAEPDLLVSDFAQVLTRELAS